MTALRSLKRKGPEATGIAPDPVARNPREKDQNMTTDSMAPAAPATVEELAALDFTQWQRSPDEWTPPSNEEWADLANPNLVTVRVAWMVMHKTKAELITMLEEIEDDLGDDMFDRLQHTSDFFRGMLAVSEGALMRLCSAGASLELSREVRS